MKWVTFFSYALCTAAQQVVLDGVKDFSCYSCINPESNLLPKIATVWRKLKSEIINPEGLKVNRNCHRTLNASQLPTHKCLKHPFCFKYTISQPEDGRHFVMRGCADRMFRYRPGTDEKTLFQTAKDGRCDKLVALPEGLYDTKPSKLCKPFDSNMQLDACACRQSLCNSAPFSSLFLPLPVALLTFAARA